MLIEQALIVFFVAGITCFAAVPFSKRLALRMGAIDYPGARRINDHAVPRAGGIAIFAGFTAGIATIAIGRAFLGWTTEDLYSVRNVDYVLLYAGLTFIFLVGLIDDVSPMSPRSKLAGQIVGATIICMAGVTIGTVRWMFTGAYVELGWFDFPLTILYLLIFMNVVNLIDGLDGLAAGIVAIMACGMAYLVFTRGSYTLVMVCVIIFAVCLAFLRYNFSPASVFMGDSGSLFLGAVVAVVAIAGVARTQSLAISLVPLVIAGVPIMDTVSAIVRRLRGKKPIGEADMEHVHHRLVEAGYSQRRSVLILYAMTAVLAAAGGLLSMVHGAPRWFLFILLAIIAFLVIYRLHLFDPVLQHYYRRRAKEEPRRGIGAKAASQAAEAEGPETHDIL